MAGERLRYRAGAALGEAFRGSSNQNVLPLGSRDWTPMLLESQKARGAHCVKSLGSGERFPLSDSGGAFRLDVARVRAGCSAHDAAEMAVQLALIAESHARRDLARPDARRE